jgi:putative IMPACT (imprinted ancient) family translation regulator
MELPVSVRIPASTSEAVYRERGSRFIAFAGRADSEEQALAARDACRVRYHDATHHVFAARFLDHVRVHDDGEPAGTGGRPVLRAIECAELHHAVVIVSRYFGGTKLGTGGLGRAYGEAARIAVDGLAIRVARSAREAVLRYSFSDTGSVMKALDAAGALRLNERYGEQVQLGIAVPLAEWGALVRRLRNETAGRITVEEGARVLVTGG